LKLVVFCARPVVLGALFLLVCGQPQQDGSDRQSDVAAADDSGGEGMKISPEQARANIVVEYERQLNEGVSVLSSAMERMRGITTAKVKSEIDSQPTLADLVVAGFEE
jgi:hypothetical protein